MDIHTLHSTTATATISAAGAELQQLRFGNLDLLWDAGPLWPRHAPLLFPIVGSLTHDALHHGGRNYPLPRHGFARDRTFTWLERTATTCSLELREDAATLTSYPFPFALRVTYTLSAADLRMDLALHNPGSAPLPASLGLHPALRWPLAPGLPKDAHRLLFEVEEPAPIRRLTPGGLLATELHPSPIEGRDLALDEGLFAADALILDHPRSRALRYEVDGGPAVDLRWEGFPHLGLWAKPDPGPTFLCIEPWAGHASPDGWDGPFDQKPGSFLLPPGATRPWSFTLGLAT